MNNTVKKIKAILNAMVSHNFNFILLFLAETVIAEARVIM
jgi:hypothetical protein